MRTTVDQFPSDFIQNVSYADGAMDVTIAGNQYRYEGVPRKVFANVVRCKSKGRAFNKHIKPNYTGVRVA
jgi:hypothetical protein